MRSPRTPLLVCSIAAYVAACSSSSSTSSPAPGADAESPDCPARAPKDGQGEYTTDALPAGACDGSIAACTMGARKICSCPEVAGPYSVYDCTCTSSVWTCTIKYAGASICFCPDSGAADATKD